MQLSHQTLGHLCCGLPQCDKVLNVLEHLQC
jgi:hypothetical protein